MNLEPFLFRWRMVAPRNGLRNDPRFHAVERLMEPAARSLRSRT